MAGRDRLLTAIIGCNLADLSLLDRVRYDWPAVLKRMRGCQLDLASLMIAVCRIGCEYIQAAVDDRICEIEALELNERELDPDEAEELASLRELDVSEDFVHNGLDTFVRCRSHADIYKIYMQEALHAFRENTGYRIILACNSAVNM